MDKSELKSGYLIRVKEGATFPADCLLLHSESKLVLIDELPLRVTLSEPCCRNVLKQTLIEAPPPLHGYLQYTINDSNLNAYTIEGELHLEEGSHKCSMANVALRGSRNAGNPLTCLVLETGIDSLLLKNTQYPIQYRE